jgi:hypothetical protein
MVEMEAVAEAQPQQEAAAENAEEERRAHRWNSRGECTQMDRQAVELYPTTFCPDSIPGEMDSGLVIIP